MFHEMLFLCHGGEIRYLFAIVLAVGYNPHPETFMKTAIVSFVISLLTSAGVIKILGGYWTNRLLQHQRQKFDAALEEYKSKLTNSRNLLQAQIDRTVLVNKVQFDTEFDALKTVWEKLTAAKLHMPSLRPLLDSADISAELKTERLKDRLRAFMELKDDLVTAIENASPFYPQEIFDTLEKCRVEIDHEILQLRSGPSEERFTPHWHEQGYNNLQYFLGFYHEVSTAIRKRIASLALLR